MSTLFTERSSLNAGARVDRSGARPRIRGVLLCGATSANRRRYPKAAFADALAKYEGRPIFLNHGDGRTARGYESRIGKVVNVRLRSDGLPIGDLEINGEHPFAAAVLSDAEYDPKSVGMSHVALCNTRHAADGFEEVTNIDRVESVDIVLDPATTKGLFENINKKTRGRTMMRLRHLIERVARESTGRRRAALSALREAAAPVLDAPAPADDGTSTDAIRSAFAAAGAALFERALDGDLDAGAAVSKLRRIITAFRDVIDGTDTSATDTDTTDDYGDDMSGTLDDTGTDPDAPSFEGRSFAASITGRPTAEQRRRFVAAVAEGPGALPARDPREGLLAAREHQRKTHTPHRPGTVPTDPKAFAASIRG